MIPSPTSNNEPLHCAECGGLLVGGTCAACAFSAMQSGPAEAEFGRYALRRCLARGGMGIVYEAADAELDRTVALKVLRSAAFAGAAELARFTLETKAAAALDHPHIVPIYEVGEVDGQPFFTMKLIRGQSLAEGLHDHGRMPAREAAALLVPVARAVHHAHLHGVLHRDLKPGNILLDAAGKPWLTDFGLAKFSTSESTLTLTSDHIGTPHYMSPEMAAGRVRECSAAGDVWALGVILWEMLSGRPPFTGQSVVEILRSIVEQEPPPPGESLRQNADLLTIARRCMEKRPADRMASAGLVADELERYLRGEPIQARPVSAVERLVKWARRKPLHAALAVLGVCFITVASLLWLRAERANVSLSRANDQLGQTNTKLGEAVRVSTATRLAAEAQLQLEESPDLALLLAAASVEMTAPPLPDSVSALTSVLQQAGGLDCTPLLRSGGRSTDDTLYGQTSMYQLVSPSADGRWLLAFGGPGPQFPGQPVPAALYDLNDLENPAPVRRWTLPAAARAASFAPVSCWLSGSREAIIIDGDGLVRLVEAVTPEMSGPPAMRELGTLPPPPDADGFVLNELQATLRRDAPGRSVLIAARWTKDADSILQRAVADESGVNHLAACRVAHAHSRESFVKLSPRGRWLLMADVHFRHEPPESGIAVRLYDFEHLDQPPRTLSGDVALAARQSEGSADALNADKILPVFGSAREDDDIVISPQPGHELRLYSLAGTAPGAVLSGTVIPGEPGFLYNAALSPDGRRLAVNRATGSLTLHRLVIAEKEGPGPRVQFDTAPALRISNSEKAPALTFSPDGQWLLSAGGQRSVHFWKLDGLVPGQPPQQLTGSPVRIGHLRMSPDSRTLIAVGNTWMMRRWHFDGVTTGANPRRIATGAAEVREIEISPDGAWVACAGAGDIHSLSEEADGWVSVGRIDGERTARLRAFGHQATGVAVSQDGRWLAAAGSGQAGAWDFRAVAAAVDAGQPFPERTFHFTHPNLPPRYDMRLTWLADSQLYLVHGHGTSLTWDFTQPDPAATLIEDRVHSILYFLPDVAVSPDGRVKAIARHGWDPPAEGKAQYLNQVLLYEGAADGKFLQALPANFKHRTSLAFSPDGRWLAAGGEGAPACLWDLRAPDIAASRRDSPAPAPLSGAVAFSPDNRRLAIGTSDGNLHLWEWENPVPTACVTTLRTGQSINTIAWLRDGRLLTGGAGPAVSLWETDVAKLVDLARRVAGRELAPSERERFGLGK